jgi:hypothetical protein
MTAAWQKLSPERQAEICSKVIDYAAVPRAQADRLAGLGLGGKALGAGRLPVVQLATLRYVPLKEGLDLSAA